MPDMEQPVTDPETEAQLETSTAAPRKKRRLGPWLFLLLIFVGLPAVWLLAPAEFRQQAVELLNAGKVQLQTKQAAQPISPPIIDSQPQIAEVDAPANASDVESEPLVDMVAPTPLESEAPVANAAESMQKEIDRLHTELSGMQAERAQLRRELKTSQTVELRVWLSLLASPDTRLSQRAGIWGELASLASLHASEQSKAREMSSLLEDARTQLASVGKSLRHLAKSIPDAQQADIIPKPENPYLAWLTGTFHLRPAPGKTEQKTSGLREQLLDMEHALSLEDWPEPSKWRQLLSALGEQFGDDAELDLPESLRDIIGDIDTTRAEAAVWMEAL